MKTILNIIGFLLFVAMVLGLFIWACALLERRRRGAGITIALLTIGMLAATIAFAANVVNGA